jgi:protein-S-isoprenylcysteine O-methyltransferase Ste14
MAHLKSLKRLAWLVLIGVCLFVPAGTLDWPGAWIFLLLFIGGMFATMGWLKRRDPALFAERAHKGWMQPGQPGWDRAFGIIMGLAWYGWITLTGLDARWSGGLPVPAAGLAAGAALMAAGYLLAARAMAANTFATTVVRLQAERGQTVVDRGPYAIVRHPMYSASLLIHIGTAVLLGSKVGLAAVPLLAILLGIRAVLEERTLREGLAGYDAYTAKVRFRIVPFLW